MDAVFQRWHNPPRYQLFDLERDPDELINLADDRYYLEIKARLIVALEIWKDETRDPFSDQENVEAYVSEQLSQPENAYRTDDNFRWEYIDRFKEWRAAR